VQQQVLATIDSKKLVTYVVWEPILRTDDERSARKATTCIPDERSRHYWVGTQDVGKLFQPAIGLTSEPAWDVYLVYPPGRQWKGESPPAPEFFMHQLGERLPEAPALDGETLAKHLQQVLQSAR
jgi:hypothetical protein